MTVLGVIPARGGSKGIPHKNLCLVQGRPLLAFTADAVRSSRHLTHAVVSTDDGEIAQVARSLGLRVPFMRPAALADDEAPMLPVLQHALEQMTPAVGTIDAVVLLQPTSPLRTGEHVDRAIELLDTTGADSVVSVIEVPHAFNPVSVMRQDGGRLVSYLDGPLVSRRQDKPRVFARNGPAVLVVRADVVRSGSLYGQDVRPFLMDAQDSLDIDSSLDLELLEFFLDRRR